jgi:membrane protease YdiL (CAAX protease family)
MEEHSIGTPPEFQRPFDSSPRRFPGSLFYNQTGLRSGWRLLIYLAIFLALLTGWIFVFSQIFRSALGVSSLTYEFIGELGSFLAAFVAAWIMSEIEERPIGTYGLPAQKTFGKLFWQGCLFGFAEISILVGSIAAFGAYSFGSLTEHGTEIVRWALFWGFFFLIVALFEEFAFRGYTLYTLADGIGFWPAALALAICFGAVHRRNPGENWIGVASVVFVGLFWSFTLRRTGSLWFALGMHASFDFGETFFYSVPDSGMVFPGHLSNATLHGPDWLTGGTPGPEASVVDFLIIAVFFLLVHFLYPARRTPKENTAAT